MYSEVQLNKHDERDDPWPIYKPKMKNEKKYGWTDEQTNVLLQRRNTKSNKWPIAQPKMKEEK